MGALSQLPPGPLHCVLSGICDTVSQTVPEGWAGLSQTFNISLATVTWFSLQITNPHLPAKCQERPFHPSIVLCTPERCGWGRGPTAPRVFSSTEKWGNNLCSLGAAGQGRVHQQDVSEQDLSRTLAIQIAFLQTSCTPCAPLTCWETDFDGQKHPKIPTPTSKAESKVLPTFLG